MSCSCDSMVVICFCLHLSSIYWLLKHWFYQNWQPVTEDEVSDEESSTHSPHQPQQVEGVKTGPLRHSGFVLLDYVHFSLVFVSFIWEIESTFMNNEYRIHIVLS